MSFTADSNVTATHAANLLIADTAAGSPQTVPMTATVINPIASASPSNLNFGTQKTNTTSAAKTVTITNTGTTSLAISGLTITGNFQIATAGTCASGSNLTPSGTCTVNVTFKPASRGSKTGNLKIASNAQRSPLTVVLSGTGN
jgi:spore coat protein U-like protein